MFRSLIALLALGCATTVHAQGSGALDTRYGERGRVLLDYFGPAQPEGPLVEATAVDPHGRLLFGGTPKREGTFVTETATVLRLTPLGELDTSFGTGGYVEMQPVFPFEGGETRLTAMATTDDARVLVLFQYHASDSLNGMRSRLCRLTTSGALDPEFGTDGCSFVEFNPEAAYEQTVDMALDDDGDIAILGSTESIPPGEFLDVVARFNSDGSRDFCFNDVTCTFGGHAYPEVPATDLSLAEQLTVAPDGRILIGYTGSAEGENDGDWWVGRLLPTGAVDTDFNVDGYVRAGLENEAILNYRVKDLIVRDNGRVILAGETKGTFGNQITLVQFDTDGNLDAGFAGDGRLDTFISDVNQYESAPQLALQDDGKLVVAGSSSVQSVGFRAGLVRLLPDGETDDDFGFDGRRYIGFLDDAEDGTADFIARDIVAGVHVVNGRIFVAGYYFHLNDQDRYYAALAVGEDDVFRDGFEADD
jgi:uncharacterized delta-60 repeat protein